MPAKLFAGALHSINVMDYSFYALKTMIVDAFKTKDVSGLSQGVAGPIGIFGAVKSVVQYGGVKTGMILLDLTALLSLSLGIMNLLPIPALDGGRLLFVVVEWISGKKPSQRLEDTAHRIGYAFLLSLLLLITLKDIIQLF